MMRAADQPGIGVDWQDGTCLTRSILPIYAEDRCLTDLDIADVIVLVAESDCVCQEMTTQL